MSIAPDTLKEMAANRGLKLVRSRVRTPGKPGFGLFGLTDASGRPVFGIVGAALTADADAIAGYLRGAEVGDWKASLKAVGGRAKVKKRHPELVSGSSSPPGPSAEKWMLKQVQHDDQALRPEPPPELREAKPGDAEQLASLFGLLEHAVDAKTVARNLKALAREGLPILVIARGDRLLAACGLARTVTPHRAAPIGRITILVVAGDWQGRGFGRQLMAEAERRLASLGCGLIEVTSNDRLTRAHSFYRHLGYERTSMRFAKLLPSG